MKINVNVNFYGECLKTSCMNLTHCPFENSSSSASSEKFSTMCKKLRILNAIKEYKIGMPLTMSQFDKLSPKVVIDRFLQRRLFALASKMCQFMQIQGEFKSWILEKVRYVNGMFLFFCYIASISIQLHMYYVIAMYLGRPAIILIS